MNLMRTKFQRVQNENALLYVTVLVIRRKTNTTCLYGIRNYSGISFFSVAIHYYCSKITYAHTSTAPLVRS